MPDDIELLRRYEPVVRFNAGEMFFPASTGDFVQACALFRATEDEPEEVAARGTLTLDRLGELGREHLGDHLYLQQVGEPLTRKEYRAWRRRPDRVRFTSSSRFAAVGFMSRFVDAFMRLTLLLRGRVPGGYAAAAQVQYAGTPGFGECFYYGHVTRDAGYIACQYWFFYPMNDWRSHFGGVNDHESDWEQVTVFLSEATLQPVWVAFSSHDEVGADLRRRWDDPDIEFVDGVHPVVYAGAGSHSGAYLRGEYLITAPIPLPGWLDGIRRFFLKVLPWREDDASGAIGIPYIDYKRGDGLSVGPGQDRPWQPVVIDDETLWVRDYRGLWGLDTQDIFGGERAPAGPRYERNGSVRQSWGQPVAWAGLDKEAPDDLGAREDLAVTQEYLTAKLTELDEEIGYVRDGLRASRAAERAQGIPVNRPTARTTELSQQLKVLRQQQLTIEQQIEGTEMGLDPRPFPPEGPHDHLHHRAVPLTADNTVRSRLLRIWSAASASVLLAALGILLLVDSGGLLWPLVWIAVAMLVIESILRRRLANLLVAVIAIAVVVLLGWALWEVITGNWRIGLGVLLLLVAAYMAVQTAREGLQSRN